MPIELIKNPFDSFKEISKKSLKSWEKLIEGLRRRKALTLGKTTQSASRLELWF